MPDDPYAEFGGGASTSSSGDPYTEFGGNTADPYRAAALASGQTTIPVYSTTVTTSAEEPPTLMSRILDWTARLPEAMANEVRDYIQHGSPAHRGLLQATLESKRQRAGLSPEEQTELTWLEQHAPQPAGFGNFIAENPMSAPIPAAVQDVAAGHPGAAMGDIIGGYGGQLLFGKALENPVGTAVETAKFVRNPVGYTARAAGRQFARGFGEGLGREAPPPGTPPPDYYAQQPDGTAEPSEAYYARQQPPPPAAAPAQPVNTPPVAQEAPPSPPQAPVGGEVPETAPAAPAETPPAQPAAQEAAAQEAAPPAEPGPLTKRVEEIKQAYRDKRAADATKLADFLQGNEWTSKDAAKLTNREQLRPYAENAGVDLPKDEDAVTKLRMALVDELGRREAGVAPALAPTPASAYPELQGTAAVVRWLVDRGASADEVANYSPERWKALGVTPDKVKAVVNEISRRETALAMQPTGAAVSLSDRLQAAADAASQRMRDRGSFSGSKLNAMPDPADVADLAIWGAAKLAKGTVDFGKWSKEMVSEFGDQIRPALQAIYTQAQKTFERHVNNIGDQLASTRELMRLVKEGASGKDWYTRTHAELVRLFGPDAEIMEKFLAATSPNNTVAGNVSQALKAYRQWRLGQPFEGYLPLHKQYLDLIGSGQPFGGRKVDSFLRNLKGETMPVAVDRWIARGFGFGDSPNLPQYKFMDYWTTQLAKRAGMEPSQVQAAIWKAVKERTERGAQTTSEPFEALLPKKIAADPAMQALIARAKAGESAPARP